MIIFKYSFIPFWRFIYIEEVELLLSKKEKIYMQFDPETIPINRLFLKMN